jgi:hypothetical protein
MNVFLLNDFLNCGRDHYLIHDYEAQVPMIKKHDLILFQKLFEKKNETYKWNKMEHCITKEYSDS